MIEAAPWTGGRLRQSRIFFIDFFIYLLVTLFFTFISEALLVLSLSHFHVKYEECEVMGQDNQDTRNKSLS